MKCVYFYSSFVIGISGYARMLRNAFRKPLYLLFLEFLLLASHFISFTPSARINRLKKNGTKVGSAWEPLLTYQTGGNVGKKVNSVDQLSSQQIWYMVQQKLEDKKKHWTSACHGSWHLLLFICFEDHEMPPSGNGDGERIPNKNWQWRCHFTCPFHPPWPSLLSCQVEGWLFCSRGI